MGFFHEEQKLRFLNQQAVETFETLIEDDIGFVSEGKKISLYRNFCAVLALCQSRQIENAEKGKTLLKRLLGFQSPHGGFPRYLHEYPLAVYDYLQLDIHQVIHELIQKHAQALGKELVSKLILGKKNLWSAIKENFNKEAVDQRTLFKYQISAFLEQESDLVDSSFDQVADSKILGETLLALRQTPYYEKELLKHIKKWNPYLGCFTGPLTEELYDENLPQLTLFDFIMSSYFGLFSKKTTHGSLMQLQAALVPALISNKEDLDEVVWDKFKQFTYKIHQTKEDSFFYFQAYEPSHFIPGRGFHLMRYLWKESDKLLSLVCQSHQHKFLKTEEGFIFEYLSSHPEDVIEQDELIFFCTKDSGLTFLINNQKGCVFRLGDEVKLKTNSKCIHLSFSLVEGEGDFIGHFSYGNRPAQLSKKASKEFEAYDLKIVLRSLRRSEKCKIHVTFKTESVAQDCHMKLPLCVDHCLQTEEFL